MKNTFAVIMMVALVTTAFGYQGKRDACRTIQSACKSAGFKTRDQVRIQCMKPLLSGSVVDKVNVSADDLASCKIRQQKAEEKRLKVQKEAKEKRLDKKNLLE